MPVYDYACPDCGPFEALAPMSDFAQPCACPSCTAQAPRVMLSAPALAIMSTSRRSAHATNERSADSPKRGGHPPGCGCCSGAKTRKTSTLHRPDGSKSFPGKRPWMISH